MQLKNSYIYLMNPYKKKSSTKKTNENDHKTYNISLESSLKVDIKNLFNAIEISSGENYFKSNFTCTIELNGNKNEVIFIINEVVKNYYLDVIVKGKRKSQIIKTLEHIQNSIQESDILNKYIQIISYDAVSEYYCNKIYPKLNELERNLRKLLFNIYVVNFGLEYYQVTITPDLQSKAKSVIQAKGTGEEKKIERLQKFFYSLEFNDIQQLLFVSHWTKVDEKSKSNFLENHSDLSKLSDEELRAAFKNISPKSDWERFFDNKMNISNVEDILKKIRKSRNNIAHCKFFYRNEYSECSKTIRELNKAIKTAIDITEKEDFVEKNRGNMEKSLKNLADLFEKTSISPNIMDSMIKSLLLFSDIFTKLKNNKPKLMNNFIEDNISDKNDNSNENT